MPALSLNNDIPNNFINSFNNSIIIIQSFNGNSEQVHFFINQIKQLTIILNWNNTYIIAYTKTKLNGKALSRNAVAFRPTQKKLIKWYRNWQIATSVYYEDRAYFTF